MSGFTGWTRIARFIYAALTTPAIGGVTGVYEDAAPQGATGEADTWIEFNALAPGEDLAEVSEHRIWTDYPVEVYAVRRGRDTVALETIADELDNRLQRAAGTAADGYIIQASRQREHFARPLVEGVEYTELGGIYSVIVQPA